jgi:hypothetical protein
VVVAFFEQRLKEVAQQMAAQQVATHSTHYTHPPPVTRRLQDCPSPHYLFPLLPLTFNSAHNLFYHSQLTCTRTTHHAPCTMHHAPRLLDAGTGGRPEAQQLNCSSEQGSRGRAL